MLPFGQRTKRVHGKKTASLHSLHEAIGQTVELRVARANIRCQARSGIVEGIHDRERPCSGKATRRHVRSKKLPELRLGVIFREECLDSILEGKVESLVTGNHSLAMQHSDHQQQQLAAQPLLPV